MRLNPYSERKSTVIMIFVIAGLIFVLRLFIIQIVDNSYTLSANNNVLRYITDYPSRGLIYDRNGELLVYNEATYDLLVVPRLAKKTDTAELCRLLNINNSIYLKKLKEAKSYSYYKASIFEKELSKETYGFLQEKLYRFPGFFVQTRTLRHYPKPIAAHTLGYIGEVNPEFINKNKYYKQGDYIGISGIEKYYEEILRGKRGLRIVMVDVFNREKGKYQAGVYDTLAVKGNDIQLSIDLALQQYGEKLMQGKTGSIVAIEPSTGQILALVSSPAYDPNLLVGRERSKNYLLLEKDKSKPLFNRALMAKYPPGSTFKLVNALIGEQEQVLFPNTTYSCEAGYSFGGLTVKCHKHSSPLDLKQSVQYSCNAYYCKAFRSIIDNRKYRNTEEGYFKWYNYVLSFGFGKKFNSDLSYESTGNVPTIKYYDRYHGKRRWNSLTVISLAIGQGELGTTPVQLANLSAIIANRGFYYIPHLIRTIESDNKIDKKFLVKHSTGIEEKYFELVVDGMEDVVEGGTGRVARIDSLKICGKTGTAQNPHGEDHSIFIAFAPKLNPKIAICVVVENAGFGATYAAPIASLMIEKYIHRKISRQELEDRMVNTVIKSEE